MYRRVLLLLLATMHSMRAYELPFINLGLTNILDGGPVRPSPGVYWEEYVFEYYASSFRDACGNKLGSPSPKYNSFGTAPEAVYEFDKKGLFGSDLGFAVVVPLILQSSVSRNSLGIIDAGPGISNPILGIYNQWPLIKRKNKPFFVHRAELDLFLPIGTNKFPEKTLNPAVTFTYIDPYWAATLYFTERFAVSWRLFYLWCGKDRKTHIQPGQAFHMNFSIEGAATKKFWAGFNGYFLQQTTLSKVCGVVKPNSKERVLGLGAGFCAFFPKEYTLLGHLYWETLVRNRPKGISLAFLLVKHF